ncbi:MAG: hydantoinase/oxoprolinase family protein [Candidatus Tectomicrobia bacterium]|nr:hydantoinase/oxoprolinase family protein [Candidatus Tectomicrobia bacterium]
MYTIDIDTGGTFTDGYIFGDGRGIGVKVETTPHDLTVCFFSCIEEGARLLGLETPRLLGQTRVIRFSSTIATNTAVQSSGPKLGVIVTGGFERTLYAAGPDNPVTAFVPPHLVVGVSEETGRRGEVVRPPNVEEVDARVRHLLENGARMVVISLRNAHLNPANELQVRRIIDAAYPRHYLGAVPLLLSHQVSLVPHDELRTNTAVVNAYFHRSLVNSLYKAEDQVRRNGYRHPLLIVTADSGVARVAKTRALNTYQSGPAAGVRGAHLLAKALGHDRVLSIDVGGTTSDVSLIAKGNPVTAHYLPINGVRVAQRVPDIVSFGVGGGSILRFRPPGEIAVGPESQGAVPGPAAFGLGGSEATPTDVWLLLGYLAPDRYLGGRKRLDPERALEAVRRRLAEPMGVDPLQAALAAKDAIETELARLILERAPVPPGVSLARATLYAFGGGAGLLAAGLARKLGMGRVCVPAFSAVFSAFGASTLDVTHVYEEIQSLANGSIAPDVLRRATAELTARAGRDMRGEGFAENEMRCTLEVECLTGLERIAGAAAPVAGGRPPEELERFVAKLPARGQYVIVRLTASCPAPHSDLAPAGERAAEASDARLGTRRIRLAAGEFEAPLYRFDGLPLGAEVPGPALVEGEHTTVLVPEGTAAGIDPIGNCVVEVRA